MNIDVMHVRKQSVFFWTDDLFADENGLRTNFFHGLLDETLLPSVIFITQYCFFARCNPLRMMTVSKFSKLLSFNP